MKRALVLAVCFVCMWFGSALAEKVQVQLSDEFSLHEILVRYNMYCRNNIDDSESYKYMVNESPSRVDLHIMDNTTTYSTQGLQDVMVLAAVNGGGKVSTIVIIAPPSMEKLMNGLYTYRLLFALDPKSEFNKEFVIKKVAEAIGGNTVAYYYSQTTNRYYSIAHRTTANGGNMTLIEAFVDK